MKKTRIYLDNCCFNRPYDNQEQLIIRLESEAKLEIQSRIKNGDLLLVWSFVLDYENNQNSDIEKKNKIFEWERFSSEYFLGTSQTKIISENLALKGFRSIDAVHIASAIESKCEYFITTDKGILKKKDNVTEINIINPIDYIREAGEKHEE